MSVLQPSASEKFRIINRNNQVFDGGKTVLEIIADFNSAGIDCDSIVCHAYDNSNGFGGFLPLKVGTKDAYYIGDENAGESLGTNTTLFQATENVWNGHFYRYQADWTLADYGAVSLSKRTINSIEYWYDYDGNVITPPMIYIGGNVGILYINDNPDIPTSLGGGAGSGYIGNPLVSNKKMVGYNVPTSSAESTKTESVNVASNIPTANVPKIGNGFARIKFLRDWEGDEEMNYSTSEHLVGTWIDGSNLYEKTFEFLNVARIQNGQTYNCDLTNIQCVYIHGVIYENNNAYPVGWSGNATLGAFYSSNGEFGIKAGDSFQNADMYLTIRYIKLQN